MPSFHTGYVAGLFSADNNNNNNNNNSNSNNLRRHKQKMSSSRRLINARLVCLHSVWPDGALLDIRWAACNHLAYPARSSLIASSRSNR